ncbi:hypothetical protein MAR_024159 [Mya arenaria]|uniref:Recombination activating protein 1 n=1 Tax=Mya arenaria TaxID=6604 RepID=A0ABY7DT55_MYAAR|nr:hypothetical protein MAR_024159 [Mya arenaria]
MNNTILCQKFIKSKTTAQEDIGTVISQYLPTENVLIRKCSSDNCFFCTLFPKRTHTDLHVLPDPTKGPDDKYVSLEECVGKETTDDHPQVRDFIVCQECRKRRVVYCSHKMSAAQKTQLARLQDLEVYTCGSSLFPSFHPLHGEVFVREALVCNMEIETSYYSAVTKKFQKICFFCGDTDILGAEDEPILSLLKQYSIVRPICRGCLEQGKKPATRNNTRFLPSG